MYMQIIAYKYSWLIFILIASIGVAFFNLWQSKAELNLVNLLISFSGFISIGSLFWIAFYNAPNFLFCWMISFVTTALCTIFIDLYILHQIEYTSKFILGFILISIGVIILK